MATAGTAQGDGSKGISGWFVGAAVLSVATAGIHVFLGTPEIMTPLLDSRLHGGVKGVVEVMWHHITALLLLAAVAAGAAAWRRDWRGPVAALIGGQFALIGVLFLSWGLYRFGSAWPMPQWTLFLVMAGLMGLGASRSRRP